MVNFNSVNNQLQEFMFERERGGYFWWRENGKDLEIVRLIEIENIAHNPETEYLPKRFPFWMAILGSLRRLKWGEFHSHPGDNDAKMSYQDYVSFYQRKRQYPCFKLMIISKTHINIY